MVDSWENGGFIVARTSERDLREVRWGTEWEVGANPFKYAVVGTFPDGKRVRREATAPTRQGALDLLEQKKNPHLHPKTTNKKSDTHTLRELFESWWDAERNRPATARKLTDGTLIQYRDQWRLHIEPDFGDRDLTSITHSELYTWLHKPRSIKPKYPLDALRALYKHGIRRGWLTPAQNPTTGGFELPSAKPDPQPVPLAEMDAIEEWLASITSYHASADGRRLHDAFVVMRATGARISEVLAIRAGAFTVKTRRLRIEQHVAKSLGDGEQTTYAVADGSKTLAGERTVIVPERAAELLAARAKGKKPDAYLFATRTGAAMSTQNFRTTLGREIDRLNEERVQSGLSPITDIHPHRLRVTVASAIVHALVQRLGLSAGLEAARKQLGHKTTKPLIHYVVEEVQVEDHSAILDELDSVMVKERKAQAVVDALIHDDVSLYLSVARADRSVFVVATRELLSEQTEHVLKVLAEHDLRLVS